MVEIFDVLEVEFLPVIFLSSFLGRTMKHGLLVAQTQHANGG